jgi:hypothetical protein
MPRPTPTRAIRTSLLIALFAAAACGRGVTTTTTGTPPPPPPPRDPRMATVFVDVGPMFTHINRYRAGPRHSHVRPAREAGQQVAVEIGALGTSIDIDPLSGPAGFRVIGVVENRDTRYTELTYGLKPSTRYLIWVAPGPRNSTNNSRTRWGLLEYPRTQTGVFPSEPVGYVLWCQNFAHPAGAVSDVDFTDPATCNVRVAGGDSPEFLLASWQPEEVGRSSVPSASALQAARGTVWLRCATGSCFASNRF